jgi:hypothetical protein
MSKFERSGSMNFIVEHLPWRRLPELVFEPLGGRAAAKEMRSRSRGRGGIAAPVAPAASSSGSSGADAASSAAGVDLAGETKAGDASSAAPTASASDEVSVVKIEPSAKRRKVGEDSVHFAGDSEGLIQYDDKGASSTSLGALASPDAARAGLPAKEVNFAPAPETVLPTLHGRGGKPLRAWSSGKFEKLPVYLTENHPSFAPIHLTWKFLEHN